MSKNTTALLIILGCIPYVILLLLTVLNPNYTTISVWSIMLGDFPLEFWLAFVLGIYFSSFTFWTRRNTPRDLVPSAIILFTILGILLSWSLRSQFLYSSNLWISLLFYFMPLLLPIIAIRLGCEIQRPKPALFRPRLLRSMISSSIVLFLCILITKGDFPGFLGRPASIPERHAWALERFPRFYPRAANYVKQCDAVINQLGKVTEIAPISGSNRTVFQAPGWTDANFTLEIVGKKGTGRAKINYEKNYYRGSFEYKVTATSKSGREKLNEINCIGSKVQPLLTLSGTLGDFSLGFQSIAFSSLGSASLKKSEIILAGGDDAGKVHLWDLSTGNLLSTLSHHKDWVLSIAFSPDGKTLATGSRDQRINLWDIPTGKLLHTLTEHTNWVQDVAFSPDGKTLISGSGDATIKLWNIDTGKVVLTLQEPSGYIGSIAMSPDGKTLVSGAAYDGNIKLWNLNTGQIIRTFPDDSDGISSLAISPDGQTLASGNKNGTIKLWNIGTGQLLHTIDGHFDEVEVSFSPDGQMLASCSLNAAKVWDVHTGERLGTFPWDSSVNTVAFGPDSKTIFGGTYTGIQIWSVVAEP